MGNPSTKLKRLVGGGKKHVFTKDNAERERERVVCQRKETGWISIANMSTSALLYLSSLEAIL